FERWNWARFHPSMFSETNPVESTERLKKFNDSIRLCVSNNGEILSMVNIELPHEKGVVHFQHSEKGNQFLDTLFEYAENNLADPESEIIKTYIYDHDIDLQEIATRHSWRINPDRQDHMAEYTITNPPPNNLPDGFIISSMAEGGDYTQRCRLNGLGFNHPDPKGWTTPAEYREVQKAPDYRPEFDLFVKTQEGEYVSGCIIWYDDYNRAVTFEPVCTIPDYRRKGFGREVMMEGIRKATAVGATRAFVGSSQEFYKAIGFEMKYPDHEWIKEL
ncbi:MAG: GNAT family N-acetyltransferase, partial [Spirochaetales bacterium]|nr:GNAT family N-acetyltransferase [Spirochaetales bacterium]